MVTLWWIKGCVFSFKRVIDSVSWWSVGRCAVNQCVGGRPVRESVVSGWWVGGSIIGGLVDGSRLLVGWCKTYLFDGGRCAVVL